jgi:hypothetical protein
MTKPAVSKATRRREVAAVDLLSREDPAMTVLLAEAVTSLGRAMEAWRMAVEAKGDPDVAMRELATVEVELRQIVGYRVRTVARVADRAMAMLDREAEESPSSSRNAASRPPSGRTE